MLGKNYIKLNGISIPNPISNSIAYENVETVNKSEAGTDLVNVSLLGKRSWSLSCNCSSHWKKIYEDIGKLTQTTMELEGEEIIVRVRIESADLIQNSALVPNTDGLYTINMTISEFG